MWLHLVSKSRGGALTSQGEPLGCLPSPHTATPLPASLPSILQPCPSLSPATLPSLFLKPPPFPLKTIKAQVVATESPSGEEGTGSAAWEGTEEVETK